MSSPTEQKYNHYRAVRSLREGRRVVSHLPGGIDCTNCYLTDNSPCDECVKEGCELKTNMMSWETFKENIDPEILKKVCTEIPNSYEHFCELYEMFHDLPELVD